MIQIEALQFSHHYSHGFCLGPISFTSNNHLIIKGENGSGKTTLLKCIARLLKIQKGSFSIQHKFSTYMDAHSGLPWNYLNGYECILLFNRIRNNKLDLKSMKELIHHNWPNEFNYLNNKCYTYSSGQVKLTKILCHLLSDCDLLLLDEPDSNLDSHNSELFYQLISHSPICTEKTIIFSSHNTDLNIKGYESIFLTKGLIDNV